MIIVTGGTRGIGFATTKVLAEAGHRVLIAGRDPQVGQQAAAAFDNVDFVHADVGVEDDCKRIVDRALELGAGKLYGLVNNAGMGRRGVFGESKASDWDEVMRVNARSVYLMTQMALNGLIAGQGSVVNVASVAGLVGEEGLAIYTASKAAVIGLTQALALEYGHVVRFNAVCPGQIATRMMQSIVDDDLRRRALELRIPKGRMARPSEVGEMIAWLLSEQASYINGTVIPVDGGETAGIRALGQAE